MNSETLSPAIAGPASGEKAGPKFDFSAFWNSPLRNPVLLLAALTLFAFWPTIKSLPGLWANDEYYSHGFLVPLIIGFIIFRWWPRLKTIPVQGSWLALPFLLVALYLSVASVMATAESIHAISLLLALTAGQALLLGWRWAIALFLPTWYLIFALPVWAVVVDAYTNPLQVVSAKIANQMLNLFGFDTFTQTPTLIMMNNYQLDVGAPCSGLKLILALTAFAALFMMIGGLKWGANLVFAASILPLALFINSLRIALIGVVGEMYGASAGAAFHDYSGYLTLVICFIVLFKFARLLGWRD